MIFKVLFYPDLLANINVWFMSLVIKKTFKAIKRVTCVCASVCVCMCVYV